MIISAERVFRMAADDSEVLWAFPFGNISHIVFRDDDDSGSGSGSSGLGLTGVELVVYSKQREKDKDRAGGLGGLSGAGSGGRESSSFSGSGSGGDNTEFLKCATREIATALYKHLAQCAFRMGNPSSVEPADLATARKEKPPPPNPGPAPTRHDRGWKLKPKEQLARADNTAMPGGLVGLGLGTGGGVGVRGWRYQFGTANRIPVRKGAWSETEVIQRGASRLLRETTGFEEQRRREAEAEAEAEVEAEALELAEGGEGRRQPSSALAASSLEDDTHRAIDERVWALLCEWTCTHTLLNTSRCLALAVLNHSPNAVQLQRVEFKEGRNYHTLGVGVGGGYDAEARTVLPGGAVVLFAYASRPSLVDLAHVKVVLQTSAFTAQVSTRPDRTECSVVGGFTAGYLEKSTSDVWAKFVLLVT